MAINYAAFLPNPSLDPSRFTPNLKQRFWWWVRLRIDDSSELKWVFGGPRMFFWCHFSGFQERTVGNRMAKSPKKWFFLDKIHNLKPLISPSFLVQKFKLWTENFGLFLLWKGQLWSIFSCSWILLSIPQWEHFIQKGGRNFFSSKFYFSLAKQCFSWFWKTPGTYLGKNSAGQNWGKIALYNANID
jgi:hypothetical protein